MSPEIVFLALAGSGPGFQHIEIISCVERVPRISGTTSILEEAEISLAGPHKPDFLKQRHQLPGRRDVRPGFLSLRVVDIAGAMP